MQCSITGGVGPPGPADGCRHNNGGCSHMCTYGIGEMIVCVCPKGLQLGSDHKTCQGTSFNIQEDSSL